MSLFARARKHIDMDRVKELREEKVRKIKNERIAEIRKQQEEILVEIKKIEEKEDTRYSDWRKELKEGMTTAGLGMINLPAELDNALETSPNTSLSDSNLLISYAEGGGISARNIRLKTVDASNYDTIQFTVTGSFNSFTSPPNSKGETYALSDRLSIGVKVGGTYSGNKLRTAFGSGTHTISIPKRFQKPNMRFDIFQQTVKQGVSGIIQISNIKFLRKTPVSLFVPLDDPEANSFMRDGVSGNLSPEEKKKKLEQQLQLSKEYLNKMFGEGMPNTATTISDYEPQQSFMDIQAGGERITKQGGKTVTDTTRGIKYGKIDGKPFRSSTPTPKSVSQQPVKGVPFTGLSPEDLQAISDRVGGSYFGTTGKTNPKTILSNPLKSGVDKDTLEKNIEASLKQLEIDNEQLKGDALKRNIGLAADLGLDILTVVTMLTPIPGDETVAIAAQASKAGVKTGAKTMAQQRTIDAFRTQVTDPKNLSRAQDAISRAPKAFKKDVAIPIKVQGKTINVKANEILRNKGFKVDSYQPQGKVLSERKRLKSPKDLVDKIPGYYDGKPAPLGFPIVEPPKMKNGMHPDLVDGKKVASRFNRLDPVSAKAMPKTGNPHIDKKVKAAAKKPK